MSDSSIQNQGSLEIVVQPGTKLREVEKTLILATLKAQKYNRTHAARILGIGIRTLQRKLKRYGLANIGLSESDHHFPANQYSMAASH